jgi:dUTP pyrophosphatase
MGESYKIDLKFVNNTTNPDPTYATEEASAFDLRAVCPYGDETLKARGRITIGTGLCFDIPPNLEIVVRPRSGLASKNGVISNIGTIDSDYTGEVKVILFNLSDEDFTIKHGDRIAQAVVTGKFAKQVVNLNKVPQINKITDRGTGGIGSTGLQ